MKKRIPDFRHMPFSRLIVEAEELSEARNIYAGKPARLRRDAADYEYHSGIAAEIAGRTPLLSDVIQTGRWPGAVFALAIDPSYAPAVLTVGSYEYLYNRKGEAMKHFLALTNFPEDTEDLAVMIDKSGNFLLDHKDYKNALTLYEAAVCKFPKTAIFYIGLSYCLLKKGKMDESILAAERAVALEPENHMALSDLGWCLAEAGRHDEALQILEKAISLSPPDYDLSRGNLQELKSRMAKERTEPG
ncbi:MAG: tetratricopeptide repeat protein [Candidatus Aminicenantes bacterium]|nr:tetratricopeptide repeat protein [Candidatus Aminicenantes bacterium]